MHNPHDQYDLNQLLSMVNSDYDRVKESKETIWTMLQANPYLSESQRLVRYNRLCKSIEEGNYPDPSTMSLSATESREREILEDILTRREKRAKERRSEQFFEYLGLVLLFLLGMIGGVILFGLATGVRLQ